MSRIVMLLVALCGLLVPGATAAGDAARDYWPSWRGPKATGASQTATPPVRWSETQNIKWKVPVPGSGSSSPVIWGDNILFLAAELVEAGGTASQPETGGGRSLSRAPDGEYRFSVVCLDRATGTMRWQKAVAQTTPRQGHHPTGSFASYSPVTDGRHIWASFGSRGMYCLDMEGNIQWSRELVPMDIVMGFGEGSSCALAGDHVVVVQDHEGDSVIHCFDKATGDLAWRKARDERSSWATPLPVQVDGRTQVIVPATNLTRAYDLATGEVIWQCAGQTRNVIPSPVTDGELVFCTSGYRGNALQAIELGRTGDLTGTDAVRWQVNDATPYVPSPLLYQNRLYVLSNNRAVLSCYQADSGAVLFQEQKVEGMRDVYASPVAAAGRIYLAGRDGCCAVIEAADTCRLVSVNQLDDAFDATPAVAGDEIYLKGRNLYCITAQ